MKTVPRLAASAALTIAVLSTNACGPQASDYTPQAEIFALVDLSKTWHNPKDDLRNERVLRELGAGIAAGAVELDPPIAIQYRVIGEGSLHQEPLCRAVFRPAIGGVGPNASPDLVHRRNDLTEFLSLDCPRKLLAAGMEPRTEISAAIASVMDEPRAAGARRKIIIASDFLEEAVEVAPLEDGDLKDVAIMLLYRPVAQDQLDPAGMSMRVRQWRDRLQALGAKVVMQPDTSLYRDQVTAFIVTQ